MEFFETVHARQSVRAYQSKPIEPKQLEVILSTANQSPSAGNVQGYEILVVRDAPTIQALANACFNQGFIAQAPLVLVFAADPARSGAKYGVAGERLFCVQDATIATAYAQLAATAMGLATCWIGAFKEEDIAKLLGLRAGLRPIALLPVGWPAETPSRTTRRALNDLVHEHNGASGGGC